MPRSDGSAASAAARVSNTRCPRAPAGARSLGTSSKVSTPRNGRRLGWRASFGSTMDMAERERFIEKLGDRVIEESEDRMIGSPEHRTSELLMDGLGERPSRGNRMCVMSAAVIAVGVFTASGFLASVTSVVMRMQVHRALYGEQRISPWDKRFVNSLLGTSGIL